jgi:hypothetical protein
VVEVSDGTLVFSDWGFDGRKLEAGLVIGDNAINGVPYSVMEKLAGLQHVNMTADEWIAAKKSGGFVMTKGAKK